MILDDEVARIKATDPTRSFIVQAPAGSGKTEILTQRFLRLLSTVHAPEQIIALTFTRKAAHEMRHRILHALQDAHSTPHSAHHARTLNYAKAALARDKALHWQLCMQPQRLRIMTIDALCQMLTHAIPTHASHYAAINEHPERVYQQAARAGIRFASHSCQEPLAILLQHLDNRQDLLINLCAQLLSQREQWLTPLYLARQQSKKTCESALATIIEQEVSRLRHSLPVDLQKNLQALVNMLLDHLPLSPYQGLQNWQSFATLNREEAILLASLLLTKTDSMRKAFDHHIGLKRDNCPADRYAYLKSQSQELLGILADFPDFITALTAVKYLPKPEFTGEQWGVLQALLHLLPLLVGHLNLEFQASNTIDFSGIAHQARLALGEEDNPTDLALYLDHRIQHVLIDEFQDTSIPQFELIGQLVQGFSPEDGRSLFVVGDPMQSIYRFRAAEVGLFLRAQNQGIGPIALTPLQLKTNFRATSTLVHWVNQHCQHIFPRHEDIASGAIAFQAASAIQPAHPDSFVTAQAFDSVEQEARALCAAIRQERETYPEASLAILVRSRHQLRAIIALLRQEKIPFQGVDIDLLGHLPHIEDVWSLTQALLMPANRLAWLAFLRSPWCGLCLADLLAIAEQDPSIYVALSQAETIRQLTPEGRIRAHFIYNVLDQALRRRHQQPLVEWLRTTLQHLHGDNILDASQQRDVEQYWSLIKKFEQDGQIADFEALRGQLAKLYAKTHAPASLQIMTIHKSKGLEFDTVFLPGLSAKSPTADLALLRWLRLPTQAKADLFLISPIKATAEERCLVYDYLGRLDKEKSQYESARLLYVALTRAKQRLYLFDHHLIPCAMTHRAMLAQHIFATPNLASLEREAPASLAPLWRLPLSYYTKPPEWEPVVPANIGLQASTPRLIGIVTHRFLQWICTHHPQDLTKLPWQLVEDALRSFGFVGEAYHHALARIQEQIHRFLSDSRGQWISQARADEKNEFELLIPGSNSTRIIDRTFTEDGMCWVIDFKTGQSDSPQHNDRAQLQDYAHLMQQNPRQIMRCGLYYLAEQQWIEWEPETCLT